MLPCYLHLLFSWYRRPTSPAALYSSDLRPWDRTPQHSLDERQVRSVACLFPGSACWARSASISTDLRGFDGTTGTRNQGANGQTTGNSFASKKRRILKWEQVSRETNNQISIAMRSYDKVTCFLKIDRTRAEHRRFFVECEGVKILAVQDAITHGVQLGSW